MQWLIRAKVSQNSARYGNVLHAHRTETYPHMAQIEQIQIRFAALEDRLLMRVAGADDLEFRFWLTRRFVRLIWTPLKTALADVPRIRAQASPAAQRELLAFEHEKAVSGTDFHTPYKETAKTTPLGNDPVLLAKMQMRRLDDGTLVMALGPENGVGIDLTLNHGLLHSFAQLLHNAAALAEWDLPDLIEQDTRTTAPADATVN